MNLGQKEIQIEILKDDYGDKISIEKYIFEFSEYNKTNELNNYGGKKFLDYNGEPVFAELLLLKILEANNYIGVWVDTYRNKFWTSLTEEINKNELNTEIKTVIENIYKLKGGKKSGCFDVVAYKENEYIFVELKRGKKDVIQNSQIEWLKSAKKLNIKSKFLLAEWTIIEK
jgi:hypothetical protein